MTFGERVKQLRKQRKMTQGALAIRAETTQAAISGWETQGAEPDFAMLIRIADIFSITVDYLIGKTEHPYALERTPSPSITDHQQQLLDAYNKSCQPVQIAICDILHIKHSTK